MHAIKNIPYVKVSVLSLVYKLYLHVFFEIKLELVLNSQVSFIKLCKENFYAKKDG